MQGCEFSWLMPTDHMVDAGEIGVLVVAALASLFMAWTVGAGWTPFAPAVGARTSTVMRGAFLTGAFALAGAILQGANVTEAMAADLIGGVTLSSIAAVVALVVAAALVAIGIFTGYPLATAFTATGAIIGVGLALGGTPAWPKYAQIGTLWVLTPFVCGGLAYLLARILRRDDVADAYAIPLLAGIAGLVLANTPFTFLDPTGDGASVAAALAEGLPLSVSFGTVLAMIAVAAVIAGLFWLDTRRDVTAGQRHLLFGIGALVAFSAGGSQVGLAVGPLVPMLDSLALPILVVLIFGGIGMTLGQWMGGPRMIKALSQDFASLGPRRAIAALIPSFALAQVAVIYGVPVSFNAIIVSAVVGSGFAAGAARISRQKMLYTVAGWAISLALSLVLAYGAIAIVESL